MTTSFVDKSSHNKHLSLLVKSVFKVFDVSQFKGVQYAYSRFIMLIFLYLMLPLFYHQSSMEKVLRSETSSCT